MDSLKRNDLLKDWLSRKLKIDFSISSASSDASFRRYFRVKTVKDTFIVMDAPPENESIEAFVKIGQILNTINVNVPDIPISEIEGIKSTRLGNRHKSEPSIQDLNNPSLYWIGEKGKEADN